MKKSLVLVLALSVAPLCAMEKNKMFGLDWPLYVGNKCKPVSSPNYFTSKSLRPINRAPLPNYALPESPIKNSNLNNDEQLSPITPQLLFQKHLNYSDPLNRSFNESGFDEYPLDELRDELSALSPIKAVNNSNLNNSMYGSLDESQLFNESITSEEQPTGIILQDPSLLNMTHLKEIQHVSIFDMNDTKNESLRMNGLNQDPSIDLSTSFNDENLVLVFDVSGNTLITKPFEKNTNAVAAMVLRQKNGIQNMANLHKLYKK